MKLMARALSVRDVHLNNLYASENSHSGIKIFKAAEINGFLGIVL